MFSHIGKFDRVKMIRAFEESLIRSFSMNMLDARISRDEAILAMGVHGCPDTSVREVMKLKSNLQRA